MVRNPILSLAVSSLLLACSSGGSGGGAACPDGGLCGAGASSGSGGVADGGGSGGSGGVSGTGFGGGTGGVAGNPNTGGVAGNGGNAGAGSGGTAGSGTGGVPSGGGGSGGSACQPVNGVCANPDDCCSKLCNGGICVGCLVAGTSCATSGDCCGGLPCTAGVCCKSAGASCQSGSDCCSGLVCNNQTCEVPCVPSGGSCQTSAQCCGGLKCANGSCQNIPSCTPSQVVISEVYGGGGSVSGSSYTHDFVELHNRGASSVTLSGWSLQYAASTGVNWSVASLSGTLAPGAYFLVQMQSAGGGTGSPLPTPDATGGLNLAQASGKIALVKDTTPLTGSCPIPSSSVADLVGYGLADCGEGGFAAPSLSITTSASRAGAACTDTDQNANDFSSTSPNPKNSAGSPNSCGCAD